jgi:hypothetical protein
VFSLLWRIRTLFHCLLASADLAWRLRAQLLKNNVVVRTLLSNQFDWYVRIRSGACPCPVVLRLAQCFGSFAVLRCCSSYDSFSYLADENDLPGYYKCERCASFRMRPSRGVVQRLLARNCRLLRADQRIVSCRGFLLSLARAVRVSIQEDNTLSGTSPSIYVAASGSGSAFSGMVIGTSGKSLL